MLNQAFIEEMKQKLIAAKAQFTEEMAGLPVHTEMGDDRESNADDLNPDEVNFDLRDRLQADIAKIDKALAKIEQGTYGTDDEGKEISQERLEILPWADTAI